MVSQDLIQMLKPAVKKGDFILASGKRSSYYVDIKSVSTKPAVLKMIAQEMRELLEGTDIDKIAGVAVGGVPIATALSLETGIPFLIIRKGKKKHGMKTNIEGEFMDGDKVVVVEDVTTTGGSVMEAVRAIRERGECDMVLVVVDRKEGAAELLKSNGVRLIPLVTAEELI
jgi:orotate phosphoribosyltransferase